MNRRQMMHATAALAVSGTLPKNPNNLPVAKIKKSKFGYGIIANATELLQKAVVQKRATVKAKIWLPKKYSQHCDEGLFWGECWIIAQRVDEGYKFYFEQCQESTITPLRSFNYIKGKADLDPAVTAIVKEDALRQEISNIVTGLRAGYLTPLHVLSQICEITCPNLASKLHQLAQEPHPTKEKMVQIVSAAIKELL